MFSYTDSVFQANNENHSKNIEFQEIPLPLAPSYSRQDGHESAYSIEYPHQQINTYGMHHNQSQQQKQHRQQQWQDHSLSQQPSSYFSSEMLPSQSDARQSVDQTSSYNHYYSISPYSSPISTHHSQNTVLNQQQNTTTKHTNNTNTNTNNIIGAPTQHARMPSLSSAQAMSSHLQNPVHAPNASQSLPPNQRPRITTSLWDDEGTVCYQVDVRGICVARRQDNDMINGTKLLNVTGMSRGKRDGILKNEKGRVVVKVGAMHLKGVWVTFARAKALAIQFNIIEHLHPLFVDDPALYFYSNQLTAHNYFIPNNPIYLQSQDSFQQANFNHHPSSHQQRPHASDSATATLSKTTGDNYMPNAPMCNYSPLLYSDHNTSSPNSRYQQQQSYQISAPSSSNNQYSNELPSAPFVPSMIPIQSQVQPQVPLYGYTPSANNSRSSITMNPY